MESNFVHSGAAGRASGKTEQSLEQRQAKPCSWEGSAMAGNWPPAASLRSMLLSVRPAKRAARKPAAHADSQSKFSIYSSEDILVFFSGGLQIIIFLEIRCVILE